MCEIIRICLKSKNIGRGSALLNRTACVPSSDPISQKQSTLSCFVNEVNRFDVDGLIIIFSFQRQVRSSPSGNDAAVPGPRKTLQKFRYALLHRDDRTSRLLVLVGKLHPGRGTGGFFLCGPRRSFPQISPARSHVRLPGDEHGSPVWPVEVRGGQAVLFPQCRLRRARWSFR